MVYLAHTNVPVSLFVLLDDLHEVVQRRTAASVASLLGNLPSRLDVLLDPPRRGSAVISSASTMAGHAEAAARARELGLLE